MKLTLTNHGTDPKEVITVFVNDYSNPDTPVFNRLEIEAGTSIDLDWQEGHRYELVPWHRLPAS